MNLALVTFDAQPDLHHDDHALVSSLAAHGLRPVPAIWSDPAVDWSAFDAALIRSTWDYFHRRDEFLAWVARVASATRLYNPASVVAWNSDKRYLRELAERGVSTVPTVWRGSGEVLDLEAIVRQTGWSRLIVKPAVSGGAFGTLRVDDSAGARRDAEAELASLSRERAFLVQPYLPAVAHGERSLLYFGGRYSHAVNKRPVTGDFRVQEMFGGVAADHEPTGAERALAEQALAASAEALRARGVDSEILYARIDVLAGEDGQPRLIEVEAIEPSLFFAQAPGAADRLATALCDRLARDNV
jgi:glutathione synthase/RimK-type ligase-like ATP-grasp enzyme